MLYQNSTTRKIPFGLLSATNNQPATGVLAASGVTLNVLISKNAGSYAAPAGSIAEVSNGDYAITPTSADTNTLGRLRGTAQAIVTSPPGAPTLGTATTGGTLPATTTYYVVISYATALGETLQSAQSSQATGAGTTNVLNVTSPTALGLISGLPAAPYYKVYVGTVSGGPYYLQNGAGTPIGSTYTLVTYTSGNPNPVSTSTAYVTSLARIDEEVEAFNPDDAVRMGLTALPNAASGAAGGLPTGNASGQVTLTSSEHTAVQADATAALNAAMPGSPTAGSAFAVIKTNLDAAVSSRSTYSGGAVASVTGNVGGVAGVTFPANFNALTNLDVAVSSRSTFAGGAVASVTGNVGGIAGVTFPANFSTFSIDNAGKVTLTTAEHTAIGVDVLDTAASSHNNAGSIGSKINSAGAAGDPWTTQLPGSYASGTAGNIVGNRLDALISSRLAGSSYTTPPTSSDVVNALLAQHGIRVLLAFAGGRFTYDADTNVLTLFDVDTGDELDSFTNTVVNNVITERVVNP